MRINMKPQHKRFTRSTAGNIVAFSGLFLAGLFFVLPLIYSVATSFKPLEELLVFPPRFIVLRPTTLNYLELPNIISSLEVPLSRYVFNSLFVSVSATGLHVIIALMAAFVLSKGRFKGLAVLFLIVQFSLLYNQYVLAVPQYIVLSKLGLVDTYLAYILPYLPSALGVFLIKQYMDGSVPDALLESAFLDGASDFRTFWSIIIPLSKPAWMTLVLFAFRDMWTFQPQGTIFTEELKILPSVMTIIISGGIARAGSAMAATVLLMIPPIIVYLLAQSNVMETMNSSGIKE